MKSTDAQGKAVRTALQLFWTAVAGIPLVGALFIVWFNSRSTEVRWLGVICGLLLASDARMLSFAQRLLDGHTGKARFGWRQLLVPAMYVLSALMLGIGIRAL